MKHYIHLIVFVLALSAFIEPVHCKPLNTYGGQLPRWGVIGEAVSVVDSPRDDANLLYTLPAGFHVRLRELSRPTGEWVMIAPAEYIRLEAVCSLERR